MIDVDTLPIPEWGLRCPRCDASLDGLRAHRCAQCGETFNILFVIAQHRPIAAIDAACPDCDYLLTGLMDDRCPECGNEFDLRSLLEDAARFGGVDANQLAIPPDAHLKRHEPVFAGTERPLPDFGLHCADCGGALAGAAGNECPACQCPFDLDSLAPRRDWISLQRFVPNNVGMMVNSILYQAGIPYVVDNARLKAVYGGDMAFAYGALRVPREFFFDALHAFAEVSREKTDDDTEWVCRNCAEAVPGGFDTCWNCGGSRHDEPRTPNLPEQ